MEPVEQGKKQNLNCQKDSMDIIANHEEINYVVVCRSDIASQRERLKENYG